MVDIVVHLSDFGMIDQVGNTFIIGKLLFATLKFFFLRFFMRFFLWPF